MNFFNEDEKDSCIDSDTFHDRWNSSKFQNNFFKNSLDGEDSSTSTPKLVIVFGRCSDLCISVKFYEIPKLLFEIFPRQRRLEYIDAKIVYRAKIFVKFYEIPTLLFNVFPRKGDSSTSTRKFFAILARFFEIPIQNPLIKLLGGEWQLNSISIGFDRIQQVVDQRDPFPLKSVRERLMPVQLRRFVGLIPRLAR